MKETKFDRFADGYRATHPVSIAASGKTPDANYKIADTARHVQGATPSPTRIIDFGSGVGNSMPYSKSLAFPRPLENCMSSPAHGAQHAVIART